MVKYINKSKAVKKAYTGMQGKIQGSKKDHLKAQKGNTEPPKKAEGLKIEQKN